MDLGNPDKNEVKLVRRIANTQDMRVEVAPFNNAREGSAVWNPEEFTSIRIVNSAAQNSHDPPKQIAYDLSSMRYGNPRYFGAGEEFTHADFWVTRAAPDQPETGIRQLVYKRLPEYT